MSLLIHERFLLQSEEAVRLYQDHAAELPIIDFHTHLPPAEIAADRRWDNLSQVWLNGDHYKWRQMRANGIAERFCTGDATDREKFDAFASTLPYLLRNPLYHWCHLELARYFQIDDLLLSSQTASQVWERSAAVLRELAADATALLPKAVERGMAYVPGAAFYADHPRPNSLRLSFVTVAPGQIERGIELLAATLNESR